MVRLNKIYTRTGDDGTTGLGNGERRPKFDRRVAAYGEVDETNSAIGLARVATASSSDAGSPGDRRDAEAHPERSVRSRRGPLHARAQKDRQPQARPSLRCESGGQVEWLEAAIDALNADLSPLRSFVLPGGAPAAAALHQARTICRRAERRIVELAASEGEAVGAPAIAYINRLSDFLFVAARYANDRGKADVLWVPGANRGEKRSKRQ